MNNKLNEKIQSQANKKFKVVSNIRPSNFSDNLGFKGKIAIIKVSLDQETILANIQKDELKTIRIYRLFNNIIAKLFSKHRNYMAMRSNSYELIGLINLAEEIDYNLAFELMTMLNSFRQEWNESLVANQLIEWSINLSLEYSESGYICESIKEGLQIFKKDETHLENELILLSLKNNELEVNPVNFYIDKNISDKLKPNYKQMCVQFNDEIDSSEAKASFTDKFEW